MKACVYMLKSKATQMVYVGSTMQLDKRVTRHMNELKLGKHHNLRLQGIWDEWQDVELSGVIEVSSEADAKALETKMITKHCAIGNCANIGVQAIGGDNLSRHPHRSDIIRRITVAVRKRIEAMTPEEKVDAFARNGELNGMFGRTHTPEARAVMSAANMGNLYRLGQRATGETKAKLSAIASGRTGEKNPFYGKSHSEETRNKVSEAKMGKATGLGFEIEIDGTVYPSYYLAARATGIPLVTIRHRALNTNPKFNNYRLLPKGPTTTESTLTDDVG